MGKDLDTLDLGEWFILRCASADTIKLTEHLKRKGYDVWTPIQRKLGRRPRTRAHFDKEVPIMPSYVFANMHHLAELHHMATVPHISEVPAFCLFQSRAGLVPLIADDQLDALREYETTERAKYQRQVAKSKPAPKFDTGAIVRLQEGPFAGLDGEVVEQHGQFTLVSFGGFHAPIKIASCLLLDDSVLEQSDAARAA